MKSITYNLFSEIIVLNKNAYISSLLDGRPPSCGNDGNPDTCAKTRMEPYPWWAIDLGRRYLLTSVAVYTTYIRGKHPDSKVRGAKMGPIWSRQDPGGSHVGPINFAIWAYICQTQRYLQNSPMSILLFFHAKFLITQAVSRTLLFGFTNRVIITFCDVSCPISL